MKIAAIYARVSSPRHISGYELGTREPTLTVICRYCDPDIANVYIDALLRDDLLLPEKLPSNPKSEGIERAPDSKRKHKG